MTIPWFLLAITLCSSFSAVESVLPLPELPKGTSTNGAAFWANVQLEINQTEGPCGERCFCDKLCSMAGDCCSGVNASHWPTAKQGPGRESFTCAYIPEISTSHTISIVDRCPGQYLDMGIKFECETAARGGLLNLPVSDPSTDVLYRNVYCALCHGAEEYVYWLETLYCSNSDKNETQIPTSATKTTEKALDLKLFKDQNRCLHKTYQHPNFTHRVCRRHISVCDKIWPDEVYEKACASHTNFINVGQTVYKNKYCAICNYEVIDILHSNCACVDISLPDVEMNGTEFEGFNSFAIVMDVNNGQFRNEKYGDIISTKDKCSNTEVYDPYTSKCRSLHCLKPLELKNGLCLPSKTVFNYSESVLTCPLISVNSTEYDMFDNRSIWVHTVESFLTPDEYIMNGTDISICAPWPLNALMFRFDKIQRVLSFIGQIISLIALAIHFITYMLFPSLRNLPGKCIMNLVFALFVAHLLFVVGVGQTGDHKVCVAVAMVMHYCFLASFFWMNVLAFELWLTFTRTEVRYNKKGTKKFLYYVFYSWVSPALIAAIGATGDVLYSHSQFVPGYGKGVCWLTNGSGLLLFFALPMGILLLLDLLFYCLVVKSMVQTSRSTVMVQRSEGKNHLFLIYVKLTTIMGFTWIFGFIATFADTPALWYIFVILNTLQGLFICLAFVCNKNVAKLFKHMCKKQVLSNRSTGTTTVGTETCNQREELPLNNESEARPKGCETEI